MKWILLIFLCLQTLNIQSNENREVVERMLEYGDQKVIQNMNV